MLCVFNPDTMTFERSIEMDDVTYCMVALEDGGAAVFCGGKLWQVNPQTGETQYLCDLPGPVGTATITPNGDLYFAHGPRLYRVER